MRAIAGMARSYMRGSAFHGMIVGASLLANPLDAVVAWKLRSRASSLLHVQPDTVIGNKRPVRRITLAR